MGLAEISPLLRLLVAETATNRPRALRDCLQDVHVLLVDLSWVMHRQALPRATAIAVLLAYLCPTEANIASAMIAAHFSLGATVDQILHHLGDAPTALSKIVFVSERSASTYVKRSIASIDSSLFVLFFSQVTLEAANWRRTPRPRSGRFDFGAYARSHFKQ